MTLMALAGGVSSLGGILGGLFGSNAKVDTSKMENASKEYLQYAKGNFGNANSSYYNEAKKGQYNTLFDMMAMNNRVNYQNMLAQGINPTQALINEWTKRAEAEARDGANNFASGLYSNGMEQVSRAYQNHTNVMAQADELKAQGSANNAQNRSNIFGGISGMGANMLGSYMQSIMPYKGINYGYTANPGGYNFSMDGINTNPQLKGWK